MRKRKASKNKTRISWSIKQ